MHPRSEGEKTTFRSDAAERLYARLDEFEAVRTRGDALTGGGCSGQHPHSEM